MNIRESSVLFRLSHGMPGEKVQGDMSKVETDCEKDRASLHVKLFVSPQYTRIKTFDGETKSYLAARSVVVDVGLRGVWILPIGMLEDAEKYLNARKAARAELIDAFLAVYPQEKEWGRVRLNGQYRESFYPGADEARKDFRLDWSYITLEVPKNLPDSVREEQTSKLAERFDRIAVDVELALRSGMAKLVEHLAESLTPGPDGKRKKFYDSSVLNLAEFLSLFSKRNVVRDSELSALVEKAQAILADGGAISNPDKLREEGALASRVRDGMAEVKRAVSSLVESTKARRFNFDD